MSTDRPALPCSSEAARLLTALRALTGPQGEPAAQRVPLATLWAAFHQAFPHRRSHPEARAELDALLRALADAGQLRLPRSPRAYDQVQQPWLPRFAALRNIAPQHEGPLARAQRVPWHPSLRFVRGLPRLTEGELAALLRCQRFLASLPDDEPLLTARERSLQLFGDEKRLDRLAKGQLFQEGRLSAALLRCRFVHVPFVSVDLGEAAGDAALILENADTFHSAWAARRAWPRGPRWLLFGCGNAILKSAPSLRDLAAPPRQLWYFGDLDWRGLEIAWELRRVVADLGDLPEVRAAAPCYQRLAAFPPSPAHSRARQLHDPTHRAAVLALLPAPLTPIIAAALDEGLRWAQEHVTQREWPALFDALGADEEPGP